MNTFVFIVEPQCDEFIDYNNIKWLGKDHFLLESFVQMSRRLHNFN